MVTERAYDIKETMKAISSSHWGLLTETENTEIKGPAKKRERQHLLLAFTLICVVGKGNIGASLS